MASPQSVLSSSFGFGCVWGIPWHWQSPALPSVSACCPAQCRYLSCPLQHWTQTTSTQVESEKDMKSATLAVCPVQCYCRHRQTAPENRRSHPPAMHQHRPHVRSPRQGRLLDEGEERQTVFGDSHVRPLCVMVLNYRPLTGPAPLGTLGRRDR